MTEAPPENLFEMCLHSADTGTFALCVTILPLLAASFAVLLPALMR